MDAKLCDKALHAAEEVDAVVEEAVLNKVNQSLVALRRPSGVSFENDHTS